jgi:anti-sigma B factor antagonist
MIDDPITRNGTEAGYVPGFACETERNGASATLRITGDLAIETEAAVRSAFVALLDQGLDDIVVDMHGVGFLDSSGMGLLAFAERMANMHDISLVVSGLRPDPRRALETAGLAGLFLIED